MTHQGYMAISPPLYQHIQTVETTPMIITEASGQSNKYLFDGSVCGSSETDETVFHDNAVFVARKFGCCCCSTSESSVVKRKDISSADITTKNPFGSVFLAWILLGCFGHHRLCAGRPISAIIMFLGFTLGIAFTAAGFAQAETSAPCGVLHSTGYCTTTNDGWLAVGIVASVVLALSILWWISDVFLLRRWTQYVSFSFVPIFSPICSYLSLTLSNELAQVFSSKLVTEVQPVSVFPHTKLKPSVLISKLNIAFSKLSNLLAVLIYLQNIEQIETTTSSTLRVFSASKNIYS